MPCSPGTDLFSPNSLAFPLLHVFALISGGLLSIGCSLLDQRALAELSFTSFLETLGKRTMGLS